MGLPVLRGVSAMGRRLRLGPTANTGRSLKVDPWRSAMSNPLLPRVGVRKVRCSAPSGRRGALLVVSVGLGVQNGAYCTH
eukprot:2490090-Alexandrium_andersonii.AAC.1